jgi:hypothetical protein
MGRLVVVAAIALFLFCQAAPRANADAGERAYRSPESLKKELVQLVGGHKDAARLHTLGKTPGGRDLILIEIGSRGAGAPAVLVAANMEGDSPPASEAAFELARLLLEEWEGEPEKRTWYIVPAGNPDGYARFFDKPLGVSFVNARPFNADRDDATDEDAPEDLNGDGYITVMRQAHPEGSWMPVEGEPLLMKRAEAEKGEKGAYRLFSEGIDNDGDGEINEDVPGGVNPGHNFPHNFEHYTETDGPWAASEVESRAIMRFAFDHPEIALVLVFGRSNSLREVPESTRKSEATRGRYKVPKRIAERMGLDPDKEYPIAELVEMARAYTGYQELTEDMVLQFLGVGAAVNPDKKDLPYWKEISKRYNEFIKEAGPGGERLASAKFSPGSVEEWSYYQYGTPCFSMDFWTLPVKKDREKKEEGELTPDEVEKMSNEEFIGLGKERIEEFLKASGAPSQYNADMVIMGLEGGMVTTKKIAGFMRKAKKKEESGGASEEDLALHAFNEDAFLPWKPYDHPTLGTVEIGGKVPYADLAPPPAVLDTILAKQLPFVRELAGLLPEIDVSRVDVERKGADAWRIDAWVTNTGFLPYPTHQGNRCKRPTPVAVTIEGKGIELIEGRKRVVSGLLEGSGGFQKISWLVRAGEGARVTIEAAGFSTGSTAKIVELGKGGGAR